MAAASLALTAFVHKVWRSTTGQSGVLEVSVFWLATLLIYLVAVIRAARRLGRVAPDEARAELFRTAGIGFVLVFFALEMP